MNEKFNERYAWIIFLIIGVMVLVGAVFKPGIVLQKLKCKYYQILKTHIMKKFYYFFKAAATLFILINLIACKTPSNDKESDKNTFNDLANMESVTSIPDSVIQYLINSAAKDFYDHQPPTVIDIRNVKAGFISSKNDTTYIICGEFLFKEKKDWDSFETIKTYGYEQNIGNSFYCQKATFEKVDNNNLSEELKRKLNQLRN